MILVVTLNPALDITYHVAGADWAGVNRPFAVHGRAGGKGLNVARTLRALGHEVAVAGLAGGLTGQAVLDGLAGTGIVADFTPIAGETRRTFAVADSTSGQTALFNEPGPAVTPEEYREFAGTYEKTVASAELVVLSGSLPPGVPDSAYAGLITAAAGVPALLDAGGAALALGAAAGPAIVKPNLAELEEAAGRSLRGPDGPDLDAVERAARLVGQRSVGQRSVGQRLVGQGAVVVSLGSDGLLAVTQAGTWHARPPGHVPGNPTGAGDAVAAGLADAFARGMDWPASLRHAAALGTAAVGTPVAGEFAIADYERLVTTVEIVGAA
jgi:tagatose 6-phosphate kinase